jgi:hypothetical protein
MSLGNDGQDRVSASRRSVLRAVGAGAATGFTLAGTATARETDGFDGAHLAYRDPDAARRAVHEHADRVLATLVERGFLDGANDLAFDDRELTPLQRDGAETAQIAVAAQTDTHEVEVVVRPQLGEAWGTARPDGAYESITVRDDDGGVTTQDCYTEHKCEDSSCASGGGCQYYERTCCNNLTKSVGTAEDCDAWETDGCCPCP